MRDIAKNTLTHYLEQFAQLIMLLIVFKGCSAGVSYVLTIIDGMAPLAWVFWLYG